VFSVLPEVPFELFIEDFVTIINIVDVLLALDAHAIAAEFSTLGYLSFKIISHGLQPIRGSGLRRFFELLDSFEVSIVHGVLIEYVPAEYLLAALSLFPYTCTGSRLECVLCLVFA
jgi:hypothetical protein